MAACEKCWADAFHRWMCNPYKSQAEHYKDLLEERKDNPCSEEEQRGKEYIMELTYSQRKRLKQKIELDLEELIDSSCLCHEKEKLENILEMLRDIELYCGN